MDLESLAFFDVFRPELLPGERPEWTGQPDNAVIFHREDWWAIPLSLVWAGLSIFWTLGAAGLWDIWILHSSRAVDFVALLLGVPFILVGQFLVWGRLLYARWLNRRTFYALTNRRALIVVYNLRGRSSSSAYLDSLTVIDKRVRLNGIGTISFGGPVIAKYQWGDDNSPRPPTFDDVDDANAVYEMAIALRGEARKAQTQSPWLQSALRG